jgi:hypothetical protein
MTISLSLPVPSSSCEICVSLEEISDASGREDFSLGAMLLCAWKWGLKLDPVSGLELLISNSDADGFAVLLVVVSFLCEPSCALFNESLRTAAVEPEHPILHVLILQSTVLSEAKRPSCRIRRFLTRPGKTLPEHDSDTTTAAVTVLSSRSSPGRGPMRPGRSLRPSPLEHLPDGPRLQVRHGCSGPRAGGGLSRHEPAWRNPCR